MRAKVARLSASRWRRSVATGSLLVMATVLLLTVAARSSDFWVRLVQAGAEAALVGGLADWFAVTALFRRPLGLPIPHTAVVPSNKDRIGAGLATFFEENFLTRDVMAAMIRVVDPARSLAAWLSDHADMAAAHVLRFALGVCDASQLRAMSRDMLRDELLKTDLRPLLGVVFSELASSGLPAALLDDALKAGDDFLKRNSDRFEERAGARRQGFFRQTVDRQLTRAIVQALHHLIADLSDPHSASRKNILAYMVKRGEIALASVGDHGWRAHAKMRIFEHPRVEAWLEELFSDLRDAASKPAAARALADVIRAMSARILADDALRAELTGAFETLAAEALPLRQELAGLIADVVRGWDAQEFSDRIELAVDSDLQFIRINGTVVGAIVGCILFVIESAL